MKVYHDCHLKHLNDLLQVEMHQFQSESFSIPGISGIGGNWLKLELELELVGIELELVRIG